MSAPRPEYEENGELLAAEVVLGVLDTAQRQAADARAAREPGFAAEIDAWVRWLAPLFDAIAPVTPSADLWPPIARRLGGDVGELAAARGTRDARALTFWRGAAGAFGAIAAGLALVVVWPRSAPLVPSKLTPPPAAPLMSARLLSPAGAPAFVVTLDGDDVVLVPAGAPPTSGRAPELWVIPDGGAPLAVGVGSFDRAVRLRRAAEAGGHGRLTLAVSIEPPAGSPTGKPTGAVIATGALQRL